jgi:Acyltransferase family
MRRPGPQNIYITAVFKNHTYSASAQTMVNSQSGQEISAHAARSQYRPEIQGLRALAVAIVITEHFNRNILPNGYLGVDIFFVISGFVITSLLSGTRQVALAPFIAEFYERRIKRLFPALLLCVVVTCAVSMLFIAPDSPIFFGSSWHTAIAAVVGLSNIFRRTGRAKSFYANMVSGCRRAVLHFLSHHVLVCCALFKKNKWTRQGADLCTFHFRCRIFDTLCVSP